MFQFVLVATHLGRNPQIPKLNDVEIVTYVESKYQNKKKKKSRGGKFNNSLRAQSLKTQSFLLHVLTSSLCTFLTHALEDLAKFSRV